MESTICLGCMQEIRAHQTVCPLCGFRADALRYERALPLKTVLNDRYIIGKDLKVTEDGITYIAYDLQSRCARIIHEYFPSQLATRGQDQMHVEIRTDSLAVYKALLSDFQELYTQMMSWGALHHVRRVCDFMLGNNTAYAVFENLEGVLLPDYLAQRGGKLGWEDANKMFSPLFEELSVIHRNGYLHRGICPENIVVLPGNHVVLISFTICSANVSNSQPGYGLADGYAAPEQYEVGQHAEWTDVYGLSAVLYRVVTGVVPPHALTRRQKETLYPADYFAKELPQYVAKALTAGMAYDQEDRFASCNALRDGLLYGIFPGQDTPVTAGAMAKQNFQDTAMTALLDDQMKQKYAAKTSSAGKTAGKSASKTATIKQSHQTVPEPAEEEHKGKDMMFIKILLISVPIVLLVVFLIYQLITGFGSSDIETDIEDTSSDVLLEEEFVEEEPEEEVEEEEDDTPQTYPVLDFVGDVYSELDVTAYEAFVFEYPQYDYSETYPAGTICAQSVESGTYVEYGTSIVLCISLGSRYVNLPDYEGYTASEYKSLLLNEYEIKSEIVREYSDTVASKEIISIDPDVDSIYDLESATAVQIYQSIGPDPTIEPEVEEEQEEVTDDTTQSTDDTTTTQ